MRETNIINNLMGNDILTKDYNIEDIFPRPNPATPEKI